MVGRRTGVYDTWTLAKPMIEGLSNRATFQSFSTYDLALENYLSARTKGFVKVVRLLGDSEEILGLLDYAEDI